MTWSVEEVGELYGFTVEWAEPGNYYLSRRNVIYFSRDLVPPFEQVTVVDSPLWKRFASNFRLAQRLLRFSATNVLPLGDGNLFIAFDKTAGIARNGVFSRFNGMVRPCRVLRSACAADKEGNVCFGEYLANNERTEMYVYCYAPRDDSVKIAYTFPAGSIRHIHGLYRDPYSDDLYCLTGDLPHECRILRTSDGFKTLDIVGEGDETWRAVSLAFTPDAVYYGTDAEFRANQIYRLSRLTGERESLGEVNGTVFYAKRVGEHIFFTTTAENAPAQKENVAALWCIEPNGRLVEIVKFPKDAWHGTLFQFGTISLPNGPGSPSELYFSLVAVKGDNRTFRITSDEGQRSESP